ncbi:MAG: SDR family oxidoreductase [Scytolyngbya sp. HA4215-MV1]|jgi:nucleoside-diphosphate-sugar epimerase|nr:SDR family oxidoreductase [Scytolyngbya sp. HA4215-MV1]
MVPILLNAGHELVGLDSGLFRECTITADICNIPELQMDFRDIQPTHLQGFDAVVHLAALSNDPLSNLFPEITNEINYTASVRLAQLAQSARVQRFLFASSCSVYGKPAGNDLVDETSEAAPSTPYNISKFRVEQDVTKLANDAFSPTFLRNATAYGVSPCLNSELVLNNLVAWAYTKGYVYIKSDGSPWRPVVHVEDISRAFLAVLEAPREVIHNQVLNVGYNDENYRISELAEIVQQVVAGSQIEYAKDGGPDLRSYRVDFGKIQRLLPEFKPQWDARRGVEQLYEAYRSNNLVFDDFEGPRFKRIDHLKQLLATNQLDATLRWRKSDDLPEKQSVF